MLNITQTRHKNTVLVEDIYNIPDSFLKDLSKKENLIKHLAKTKAKILEDRSQELSKLSLLNSWLTDVFIYGEWIKEKDIIEFSHHEILDLCKSMAKMGVFTSISKLISYCKLFNIFTTWAYENMLRTDMITTIDITQYLNIDSLLITKEPLTKLELKELLSNVMKEDSKIAILALIEGMKISELLSIKKEDVKEDSNIIVLPTRNFTCSDQLISMLRKYKNAEKGIRQVHYALTMSLLANTDYVIRPTINSRNANRPMSATSFATSVNQDIGIKGINTNDIRVYAIWNDIIDKMPLDKLNKKYGLKHKYYTFAIRDKEAFKTLQEKRKKEKALQVI